MDVSRFMSPAFAGLRAAVVGFDGSNAYDEQSAAQYLFEAHRQYEDELHFQPSIKSCPDELLSNIFLHYCESSMSYYGPNSRAGPQKLGQVCSKWRRIVLGIPKLWSYIEVQTVPDSTNDMVWKLEQQRLERSLELSKSLPLDVRIRFPEPWAVDYEAFANASVWSHDVELEYEGDAPHGRESVERHHFFVLGQQLRIVSTLVADRWTVLCLSNIKMIDAFDWSVYDSPSWFQGKIQNLECLEIHDFRYREGRLDFLLNEFKQATKVRTWLVTESRHSPYLDTTQNTFPELKDIYLRNVRQPEEWIRWCKSFSNVVPDVSGCYIYGVHESEESDDE